MSQVIAIHSFRGGTGKSNLSANLAAQLAIQGKRVAVMDTDINSPGLHVLFGLNEDSVKFTLNQHLRGEIPIEQVALRIGEQASANTGLRQLADKHLWLVPSSINTQEITFILRAGYDVDRLNQSLQTLQTSLKLDYLILDTHPGLNEETLLSIAITDILLLVMRPDQQDFQGTMVTTKIARTLEVPNLFLVVNKLLARYDAQQMADDVQGLYQAPAIGVLPLSEDVADLGSADIFSLVYPDHQWSQIIKQIADHVAATS
ncbi:MAG TPA: MinD/ParA family protein [Anaerolineae bacterium]|nr:MinD/ParA family protein [Anaerolineae bacterium]